MALPTSTEIGVNPTVQLVTTERDLDEWDAFVHRCADSRVYHLASWNRIIRRVHGQQCIYLAARNDCGQIQGVLPLVRVRSRIFGHFLVSMPFVSYGGPIGSDAAVRALAGHAGELAGKSRVDLLELRSDRQLPVELEASHHKVTVLLDLPEDPAELWDSFRSKLRSQIRRPQKEGIRVRFGHSECESFYRVFSRHMRDLGTPVQGKRFFRALREEFDEDRLWFGSAYLDDVPVASGAGFIWNGEFELVWASSLRKYSRMSPNMALYWAFMEHAIGHGVRLFNFGRCSPGSGTHRFKLQWGGREEPLWWYRPAQRAAAGTPQPTDSKFRAAVKLWSKMPVPVTNLLGPGIVKYIP